MESEMRADDRRCRGPRRLRACLSWSVNPHSGQRGSRTLSFLMVMLEIGSMVGDLRIERELGRGAFGCVYLAHDTLIDRNVALKVVPEHGSETLPRERERILREARAAGQLSHPNVVGLHRVHAHGELRAWLFEMEYVDGGTLAARISSREPLSAALARSIFSGITEALRAASAAGIVHGDLKPGNVMLTADGVPKLADFGLSHFLGEDSVSASSTEGMTGTPQYAAPEVVMGQRPNPSSDLWSLGVMLYRMLAGRLPFAAKELTALFYAILNSDPLELPSQAPRDLAEIALRLLSRDAAQRGVLDDLIVNTRSTAVAEPAVRPQQDDRPLVGRQSECKRLRAAVDDLLAEGKGGAVVMTGEPGIGKSELARWTLAQAEAAGIACCEARVNSIEGLLRPVFTALRSELESLSGSQTEASRSAWKLARRYAGEPASMTRSEVSEPAWAMENTLRSTLLSGPVVLLIDDAHYLNEHEKSIVGQVGRRLRDEGLLLVLAGRRAADEQTGHDDAAPGPDFDAAFASLEPRHLRLEPLDRESAYVLLLNNAGAPSVSPEVARRVLEAAGGNPLFILEILRQMGDAGVAMIENRELVPGTAWDRAAVPDRLRELIEVRVHGLPAGQRDLLDVAAVDGVEFSAKAISGVLEMPELSVLRELQRLYRDHGLIAPLENGYRFGSALIRTVLLREIAPELRRAFHAGLAEFYDGQPAGTISAERLAGHFESAGDLARAAPLYLDAATVRCERQDPERAIQFAERGGIRATGTDPALLVERSRLVLGLGGLYNDHGLREEAEGLLDSLHAAALAHDDQMLALRTRVVQQLVRLKSDGIDAVSSPELEQAAEVLTDHVEGGRAHYALGLIAIRAGRLEEAERHCQAADRVFLAHRAIGLHSSALNSLATIATRRQDWEAAGRLYEESAEQSRRVGRLANAAISDLNGGLSALRRGDLTDARPRIERAVRILELEGSALYAAHARVVLAETLASVGEFAEAREVVEKSVADLDGGRLPIGLVAALTMRARLGIACGSLDEAHRALGRARELAQKAGDSQSQSQIELLTSRLLVLLGDFDDATRSFSEAIRLAEASGDVFQREGLPQALLELAVFGLHPDAVRRLAAELEVRDDAPQAIVDAATEWANGDADRMRAAANALHEQMAGFGRWERVQLAGILQARAEDGAESVRLTQQTADTARASGHVWLELAALKLSPSEENAGRVAELLDGIESFGNDPAHSAALRSAWLQS